MTISCVVLSILTDKGPLAIRAYPDQISKKKILNLAKNCLSSDSFEGQIVIGSLEKQSFISYNCLMLFQRIPILASLAVVFNKPNKDFSQFEVTTLPLIENFKEEQKRDLALITENLSLFYQSLQPIHFNFTTSSTISISVEALKKEKKEDTFQKLQKELWLKEDLQQEENTSEKSTPK